MSFRAGVDHYEWCIVNYKDVSAARHFNWKLKGNRKGDNMSVSIRNHVYCCCFQWRVFFPRDQFFLFMYQWSHKPLPANWQSVSMEMNGMSQTQGHDFISRSSTRRVQALMTAHCKSHLFGQTMGKRERLELDWVILGVAWVGDERLWWLFLEGWLLLWKKGNWLVIVCALAGCCFQVVARAMYSCFTVY